MDYDVDGQTSQIGASTKIMIVAILSVLIVVAIIVALHFYSKRLLRREERMRRRAMIDRLSRQIMPIVGDSIESTRDVGLAPSVIASIPTSPYNRTDQHGRGEQVECSVCLMGIEDEEMVRVLPNCHHMFHVECVDMWLGSHSTCPICRTEAEPKAQQESNNGPRVQPSAPEDNNGPNTAQLEKVVGSGSRLGSFRNFVTRSRSSGEEARVEDIERQ